MTVLGEFVFPDNMKRWVGYKAVTINERNGVRCLAYVDYGSRDRRKEQGPDLSRQDWKKYFDVLDDGRLHERLQISHEDEYRSKESVRRAWTTHFGDKKTQFRIDRIIRPEAKFLSVREVSP